MIPTPSKMGDWTDLQLLALSPRRWYQAHASIPFRQTSLRQLVGDLCSSSVRQLILRSVRIRRARITVPRLRRPLQISKSGAGILQTSGRVLSGPQAAVNPQQVSCPNALLTVP